MSAQATRPRPLIRRADPVKAAWNEYLAHTRCLAGAHYAEVEPWAWARLQSVLALHGGKR